MVFDDVPATDTGYLSAFELEVTTTEPMAKTDANGTYALTVPDANTSCAVSAASSLTRCS